MLISLDQCYDFVKEESIAYKQDIGSKEQFLPSI